MSTRPFTQHYDPFDTGVRTVVGQITTLGVLVLVVLDRLFPNKVARGRLEFMFDVDPKTVAKALINLETFGFASRSGSAKAELWIATSLGSQVLRQTGLAASMAASTALLPSSAQPAQPALPLLAELLLDQPKMNGENLSVQRSSSSDLIDQDLIDRSDQIEEEEDAEKISEPDRRSAVAVWCGQKSVTGEKRERVLADAWCTVARLDAWLTEMERRGASGSIKFRNRFGALNYAITCCLNHDAPPAPYAVLAAPLATGPSSGPENFSESAADPVAAVHLRYPPIESKTWAYIRDELVSDLKNVAARRICEALYPAHFDDARLQLVVVDPTGLGIARQFKISIERMLKRDTDRTYTVDFVTL